MRMSAERVARQVLFRQLRGTRPMDSPPVSLRSLMRKDVLQLHGGKGQVLVSTVHGEGCVVH
jgi:hypothetical protein